jgi:peptidoglycan/LPS O-acetylase OafA/YrhL
MVLAIFFVLNESQWIDLGKARVFIRLAMIFLAGSSFFLCNQSIAWRFRHAMLAAFLAAVSLFNVAWAEVSVGILWGYSILYFAVHAKELRLFNKFPDISYGLYLYAWPVTKIIYWNWPHADAYICMVATFAISLLLGAGSWYCIEKPFMQLKYPARPRAAV